MDTTATSSFGVPFLFAAAPLIVRAQSAKKTPTRKTSGNGAGQTTTIRATDAE